MRAAYSQQHWRHRHTFDEAMADESLRRVLRMLAVQAARVALRRQAIQACQAVRTRALPTHPPTFDRKRAAAGEREDD